MLRARKAGKLPMSMLLGCLFMGVGAHAQQTNQAPLYNESIVKLVKAGFKEKTIIAIIQTRPNRFRLDPEQLIELKRGGVSENVILAMLSQDGSLVPTDDWDDDAFFRSAQNGSGSASSPDSRTDIFGSSSGSRSESRRRGGTREGNQSEGTVTGSATVRIIGPPTEGPEAVKLERTPSLNNEEIIRLIDAGFSEGTIIKQIENSPADFDLSPPKLEELQKHRVTEPIIAAMTAAMGDSSNKPARP